MNALSRLSFEKQASVGLGVIALLGLFVCLLFGYSIEGHIELNQKIKISREIVSETSKTFSLIKDAETAQRGYFLTNQIEYLKPYNYAYYHVPIEINKLLSLSKKNRLQHERVQRLKELTHQKLAELQETLELKKNNRTTEAFRLINSGKGNRLMEEIRIIATQIESIERKKVDQLVAERERTDNRDKLLVFTAAIIGLLQVFLVFHLNTRGLTKLRQVQIDLNQLNAELTAATEELRQKNQVLHDLNSELQEERNTVAKSNLIQSNIIRTASHELRTPLTSMLTGIELLEYYNQRWTQEKRTRYFSQIKNNINYLVKIIEQMLTLNRLQSGRSEIDLGLININNLCLELIESLNDDPKVTQNVYFDSTDCDLTLLIDENLTRQCLINLLSNAIKYSPENTIIQVKIKTTETTAIVSIIDQGIGIPPDDIEELFTPFHRASNVSNISGSGIGLSVVKEAMELQGGTIEVESVVGVGTAFRLVFPLTESENRQSA